MGVIQLPVGRLSGRLAERSALRRGLARRQVHLRVVKLLPEATAEASRACDRCSASIAGGAVIEGRNFYCSLECSAGEQPPAAG